VEVRGWSVKDKAAIRARAATGDERTVMTGSSSADWVGKAYRATSADRTGSQPIFDQSDADAFARARFNDASLALVTGEGRMLGRPELRAGSVVKITGAGQRFSGAYYLTNVSHTYRAQGGYMTTFTGRRNAL
jgi:phage protein D